MRCAVVVSDMTFPPREGLHQQLNNVIKMLSHHSDQLAVFVYCRDVSSFDRRSFLQTLPRTVEGQIVTYSGSSLLYGIQAWFVAPFRKRDRELIDAVKQFNPDVIHLDGSIAAGLHRHLRFLPGVISWVDPGSLRQLRLARKASLLRAARHLIAAVVFYGFEVMCRSRTKVWHVVSTDDEQYLRKVHPGQSVVQIPVTVPDAIIGAGSPNFAPSVVGRKHELQASIRRLRVLIFADLRVDHMRRSLRSLFTDCLDPIATELGSVLYIVLGRASDTSGYPPLPPPAEVEFVEWVDDISQFLRSCDIVLLPDRVGTGIKNRTVQALANGCAIIGTPEAFQGVSATSGEHAIIADSWSSWRGALLMLARDKALRGKIRQLAPQAVVEFDERDVEEKWLNLYSSLASSRAEPR